MSAYDRKRCLRPAGNGDGEEKKNRARLVCVIYPSRCVTRIFFRNNFSLVSLTRGIVSFKIISRQRKSHYSTTKHHSNDSNRRSRFYNTGRGNVRREQEKKGPDSGERYAKR